MNKKIIIGTILFILIIAVINIIQTEEYVVQYLDNGNLKTEVGTKQQIDSLVLELQNSEIKYWID